ncbi:MAG: YcxB family protein [Pseudomonadota bacterium]
MIASATAVLLFRLPEGRHPLEIIPFIWWPFWLIPICGSVFIVYAHWIVTVPLALMIHRHNAVADEEITVTISETGIASEAEKFRGEINWPAIQRIIETPKHLFMTISKREAVTLPRRAFEAKEDYQAMRDFARAHVPEGTRYETV